MSMNFLDLFRSSLVEAGVFLNFHPRRNQVIAETAKTLPEDELLRMGMLVGTQPSVTTGYFAAVLADRAANGEVEARVTLRFCIGSRHEAIATATALTSLDGLQELYDALQLHGSRALEPLVRSIMDRARRETNEVESDLLWELVKRILRKHDDLTEVIVESTMSRAA